MPSRLERMRPSAAGPGRALAGAARLAVRGCALAGAAGLAVAAAAGPALAGSGLASTAPARAHLARTLKASDTAHMHYVSAKGSLLYEVGRASGTLPGSMKARMRVSATFSGTFTIYTSGGSITGRGSAAPHGSGVYESFAGTLTVTGGTGRYSKARGRAGLYGTFNRNTYALTVQTTGTLRY